jgi:CheY-like chemotaxis protein
MAERRPTPLKAESPCVVVVGSYSDGDMYVEYLASVGFNVAHARTPEHALTLLRTRVPAVIITDMVFENSDYDGPAFISAIRQRPDCAAASVILVSGYIQPKDRARARMAGADVFLIKPCSPNILSEHVARGLVAHQHRARPEWNWPEE